MDEFNYLAVFVSIILGLGVTQLLSGVARWIEDRPVFYGPSLAWAAILLVAHIQNWWTLFGLRTHAEWTFPEFFVLLLQPITLYLLAYLVLPGAGASLDLRQTYHRHRRPFFAILIALLCISLGKDLILGGALPNAANLAFHAALVACSALAIATAAEFFHKLFAYGAGISLGLYIGALFMTLQ